MKRKKDKVEDNLKELDSLDFNDLDTEWNPEPGRSGQWRLIEQLSEQRWLKMQLADFDDYFLD